MNSKAWKVSSSVIIALRSCASNGKYSSNLSNVQLLSLRRGESDKHLPGIHVFPGGHLNESDLSLAWMDLFKSFGYDESSFTNLSSDGGIEHLPEYKTSTDQKCVPGWMSLRLCAIRETFEESGIFLCRTPNQCQNGLPFASYKTLSDVAGWQKRVMTDPKQMLDLCHFAGCVPDLWGLHLWSNWLTPPQQRVRHNSILFLAVLNSVPPFSVDNSEMDELKCCLVSDLINDAHAGKIRLANPQYYEALRLSYFKNVDDLASFASDRARFGCGRTMPVQEKTKNGMLFILPGDSAYPSNVDYETSAELVKRQESMEELRKKYSSSMEHCTEQRCILAVYVNEL